MKLFLIHFTNNIFGESSPIPLAIHLYFVRSRLFLYKNAIDITSLLFITVVFRTHTSLHDEIGLVCPSDSGRLSLHGVKSPQSCSADCFRVRAVPVVADLKTADCGNMANKTLCGRTATHNYAFVLALVCFGECPNHGMVCICTLWIQYSGVSTVMPVLSYILNLSVLYLYPDLTSKEHTMGSV